MTLLQKAHAKAPKPVLSEGEGTPSYQREKSVKSVKSVVFSGDSAVNSEQSNATEHERPKPGWLDAARASATATELVLWRALEEVEDPEWPVSVVDMGLIYDLGYQDRQVDVKLTFTAMGCPCMEFIIGDIRERLLQEENVDTVHMEIVWDPPWTRRRLTEKGREKLRLWGIAA